MTHEACPRCKPHLEQLRLHLAAYLVPCDIPTRDLWQRAREGGRNALGRIFVVAKEVAQLGWALERANHFNSVDAREAQAGHRGKLCIDGLRDGSIFRLRDLEEDATTCAVVPGGLELAMVEAA